MKPYSPLAFPEIFNALAGAGFSADCSADLIADKLANVLAIKGEEQLPAWYKVTDLAAESIAAAGLMLQQRANVQSQSIQVDRRLACLWFDMSIRPL